MMMSPWQVCLLHLSSAVWNVRTCVAPLSKSSQMSCSYKHKIHPLNTKGFKWTWLVLDIIAKAESIKVEQNQRAI